MSLYVRTLDVPCPYVSPQGVACRAMAGERCKPDGRVGAFHGCRIEAADKERDRRRADVSPRRTP